MEIKEEKREELAMEDSINGETRYNPSGSRGKGRSFIGEEGEETGEKDDDVSDEVSDGDSNFESPPVWRYAAQELSGRAKDMEEIMGSHPRPKTLLGLFGPEKTHWDWLKSPSPFVKEKGEGFDGSEGVPRLGH